MSANQLFYKVINPKTIIVIPDNAQKHAQYDELVVRVFYISHADAPELAQMVNTIMRIPTMPVQPMLMPNKTANTITVRATAPVVDVIERIIRANDKPRAEVVIDVQILEVNRQAREGARLEPEQLRARPARSPRRSRRRTRRGTDRRRPRRRRST